MKNQLTKVMALSSAMCLLLLIIRIQWSGSISYIFLPWNLFLAWMPYLFSQLLIESDKNKGSGFLKLTLLCSWLVFFPNSPYILTDLFHLKLRSGIPLWFDLVLILSFAWNGLLLGYASLFEVSRFLKARFSTSLVNSFIIGLLVLCSFGIYLGRFPRYNSWDIITSPIVLFSDIFNMLVHPFHNTRMVGVTFFFSLFLLACYWTLTALIEQKKNERE